VLQLRRVLTPPDTGDHPVAVHEHEHVVVHQWVARTLRRKEERQVQAERYDVADVRVHGADVADPVLLQRLLTLVLFKRHLAGLVLFPERTGVAVPLSVVK
jgi:hypothetical protein